MYLCYIDESGTADIPGNTLHAARFMAIASEQRRARIIFDVCWCSYNPQSLSLMLISGADKAH